MSDVYIYYHIDKKSTDLQGKTLMNLDQAIGSFLGLAIGDALGCTLEFTKRKPEDKMHTEIIGGGHFAVAPGSYTDDTCMAMAMATSLLKEKSFNAISIMQEFVFIILQIMHGDYL